MRLFSWARADDTDALDVDGNGWSSRFHRLLMSGAMVIKATIYQEWQSDLMIPWYHYVVSYYSDYRVNDDR